VAEALPITFFAEQGAVCFEVDGCRPGEALRTEAVNAAVSLVAAVPEVRARVVAWLRAMRRFGRLVMEGRDIGTVVFPDTACKFYLDASPGERARRRFLEEGGGEPRSVEQVSASLSRRDRIDSSRQTAPLRRADGAVVIDSTGMRVDDVVAAVLRHAADAGVREASRP
jgi:cytidylate kinase